MNTYNENIYYLATYKEKRIDFFIYGHTKKDYYQEPVRISSEILPLVD